jgi:hypothetical protein
MKGKEKMEEIRGAAAGGAFEKYGEKNRGCYHSARSEG